MIVALIPWRVAGTEIGIPRGSRAETCPVRAMEAWLRAADRHYGPVFRKVGRWGSVEPAALHRTTLSELLARCVAQVGLTTAGFERLNRPEFAGGW